jgi:hypothetical protein
MGTKKSKAKMKTKTCVSFSDAPNGRTSVRPFAFASSLRDFATLARNPPEGPCPDTSPSRLFCVSAGMVLFFSGRTAVPFIQRIALVNAVAASTGVEVAAHFERIELRVGDVDRPAMEGPALPPRNAFTRSRRWLHVSCFIETKSEAAQGRPRLKVVHEPYQRSNHKLRN